LGGIVVQWRLNGEVQLEQKEKKEKKRKKKERKKKRIKKTQAPEISMSLRSSR